LGEVRASLDGKDVDLGSPKSRAVLAALAMAEGQPLGIDALTEVVWREDQVPANPVGGLHVYISGLRRALEPPRAPRARPEVLLTSGGGYALALSHVAIDAVEVAQVATRVRRLLGAAQGQVVPAPAVPVDLLEKTLEEVETALAVWRGEPYLDLVPTLVVEAARVRLDGVRMSLLEDLAVTLLALGRAGEAAGQLGGLVVQRPLDERLWSLYAVALARSDRQADALEALRRTRHHLAEELGVDPGPALRELEGMLLRQDPALHASVPAATVQAVAPSGSTTSAAAQAQEVPADDFVGRGRETGMLADQLSSGGTRLVQVVGEAGIGKSTLAGWFATQARARGDLVCVTHCPDDEGAPPLWPWAEILGQLTAGGTLQPEDVGGQLSALLGGGEADQATRTVDNSEVARFRLFEALERALSTAVARRRCVLVLEDLHWADSSTARLVAHLASAWAVDDARRDLVLVLTRRPDEAVAGRPGLAAAVEALARHGALRIDLRGLGPEDVAALAQRRTSWEVDDTTAVALHARTSGNPFMLVELLRLGESALEVGAVPAGVADVLQRRLATMPAHTRAVLATASVVGNEYDLDVVAEASRFADGSGVDLDGAVDATLDALSPAVAAGLVHDTGADRMAFVHALMRDAVYAGVTATRRARLHARVAQALETRGGRPGTWSAEVARHWLAAGPRHAGRAWRAAQEAGLASERRLALDEAALLLDEAMTAQDLDETATAEERNEVAMSACRALVRAGLWERFIGRVEEAAASAEARGEVDLAAEFACMPAEAGPWTPRAYGTDDPGAISRLRRLLELLPSRDSPLRCRSMLALGSELYFRPGSAQERQALVDEGLTMARRIGDPALIGRVSQRAALVIWRGGNAEARLALASEAVDAATLSGDTELLQTARELRMSAALEAGRISLMLTDIEQAASLLEQRPTPYHAVVLACLLVPWLAAQGRDDDAQARYDHAARLGLGSQLPWAGLALGTARIGLGVWRGDLAAPDAALAALFAHSEDVLPALRLLKAVRTDDLAGVRAFLGSEADRLATDDFTSLFHRALAAEAAYLVGDRIMAAESYAALSEVAGHVVSAGTGIPLGPADAFLALAAATTGDELLATRHAEDAETLMKDWGLTACAAWLEERRSRGGW
jgi:DNA-binding SARP family transcriptional activator